MGTVLGVICFVLVELILVWTIISWGFRRQWNSLAKDFPPLEVVEPSVTKSFQTFRVNSLNLGNCIHVTLDDRSLHLNPAKMLRWMGMLPVSIPWEFIKGIETDQANAIFSLSSKFRRVKVGSVNVTGPAWCFQLVFGEETPPAEGKSPLSQ